MNKYRFLPFTLVLVLIFTFSCGPAYKANIDYHMGGDILWPEGQEKPRIKYLWSVHSLVPPGTSFLDFLAGGTNPYDPKDSLTLVGPQSVYFENDRLYITDPSAMRGTVINIKTMDVLHLGISGKGELWYPIGIVADKAGNIYVSDSGLNKVFVYNKDGKFLKRFSKVNFQRPTGLAYDKDKDIIYVVDTLAHSVYGIGSDGNVKVSFGQRGTGDSEFNYPVYAVVDKAGMLCVTDSMNFRIQCFDRDGSFIFKFGGIGDEYDRFSMPKGIALDSEGNIYVVDAKQDMVKIFDSSGNIMLFFGKEGTDMGKFWLPSGIFIDKDDKIYVADTFNHRVQVFQFLGGK